MHCTGCGAALPADARFCAACGQQVGGGAAPAASSEKPKSSAGETAKGVVGLIVLVALGALLLSTCEGETDEQKQENALAAAEDKRKGFHCLSEWDGSNKSLVDQVKAQLRDPKSFEHDETRIAPANASTEGKHAVSMRYRARNGFGGMNALVAVARVDPKTCAATPLSLGTE